VRLYNRGKEGICAKKEKSTSIVKREEKRGMRVH